MKNKKIQLIILGDNMIFATKKELMYMGIITGIFILIVVILSLTLPLSKDEPKDQNKDINNFNPAFDQNNYDYIQKLNEDQNKAYFECVNICKQFKGTSSSYNNGPCLSDE